MKELGISLVLSSYQAGKLIMLGCTTDGKLALADRTFDTPMALLVDGNQLILSTRLHLWRFANMVDEGHAFQDYDAVFAPRSCFVIGQMDVHDLVQAPDGQLWFLNTLFSCLATTDSRHNFRVTWKPAFIKSLSPHDHCHLNGVASANGVPSYYSAVAATDTPEGWRPFRKTGGIIIEASTGEPILQGLSMPHTPRFHDGKLYVLNSLEGTMGVVDLARSAYDPIFNCMGFGRGLAFHGRYAFIGLSKPRKKGSFEGMPLGEHLKKSGQDAICGLQVVDLSTGTLVHSLSFDSMIQEVFAVEVLPGYLRPGLMGLSDEETTKFLSFK